MRYLLINDFNLIAIYTSYPYNKQNDNLGY